MGGWRELPARGKRSLISGGRAVGSAMRETIVPYYALGQGRGGPRGWIPSGGGEWEHCKEERRGPFLRKRGTPGFSNSWKERGGLATTRGNLRKPPSFKEAEIPGGELSTTSSLKSPIRRIREKVIPLILRSSFLQEKVLHERLKRVSSNRRGGENLFGMVLLTAPEELTILEKSLGKKVGSLYYSPRPRVLKKISGRSGKSTVHRETFTCVYPLVKGGSKPRT